VQPYQGFPVRMFLHDSIGLSSSPRASYCSSAGACRAPSCLTPKQHFQKDTALQAYPRMTLAPSRLSSPSVPLPCSERNAPAHIDFYRARLKTLIIETYTQPRLQSSHSKLLSNGTRASTTIQNLYWRVRNSHLIFDSKRLRLADSRVLANHASP
jgi:hypothetical protein